MATIQDIFDWLNQGAQGDIPGTDPSLPGSPSQTAQPQQQPPPPSPPPPPDGSQGKEQDEAQKGAQAGQKAGQGLWAMLFGKQPQKTPQDYSGGIPPHLLDHYNALVQSGLPPNVAHSILTQPSVGEGDTSLDQALHTWPYPYAGAQQEYQSAQQSPPSYQELWGQLQNKSLNEQMNLPTQEQNTPGDDDNLGFTRLPSGQYVPWGWGGQ